MQIAAREHNYHFYLFNRIIIIDIWILKFRLNKKKFQIYISKFILYYTLSDIIVVKF